MADYRRFIAYIYEYINGDKENNAGFVKVESRTGVCRLQIQLQGITRGDTNLRVDGFVRTRNGVEIIPLGICNVNEAMAEFKGNTPHKNFGNSEFGLDQIGGMYLEGDRGSIFATAWDNDNVDVEELHRLIQTIHKKDESESQKDAEEAKQDKNSVITNLEGKETPDSKADTETKAEMQVTVDKQSAEQINVQTETLVQGNSQSTESGSGDDASSSNREASHLMMQAASTEISQESSTDAASNQFSQYEEGFAPPEDDYSSRAANRSSCQNRCMNRNQNQGSGKVRAAQAAQAAQAQPYSYTQSQMNNRQPIYGRGNGLNNSSSLERKWDHLQCQYPSTDPFEDNEYVECLQIAPKDLMYLRRDDWKFSRNNFLLQGYNNYGHLLLGKSKEGGFVLGVPGLSENQERFLANMYGFMTFKPGKATAERTEKFGYWLRPVH